MKTRMTTWVPLLLSMTNPAFAGPVGGEYEAAASLVCYEKVDKGGTWDPSGAPDERKELDADGHAVILGRTRTGTYVANALGNGKGGIVFTANAGAAQAVAEGAVSSNQDLRLIVADTSGNGLFTYIACKIQ